MQKPLQTSDLVFSTSAGNFSETLKSIKRSTLSISNRLRSIEQDSHFVCAVADAYNLPLVANERCGSWYIPPERKAGSAYFKSTDGHMGEWSFSLRRLNTQVLYVIGQHDGCVIVDSTRRGKRMPDALSKTVPIWCAVLNTALFPEQNDAHQLHTPPQSVSRSEHSQIESRLDGFVKQFQELGLPLSTFRDKLSKPLRPLWVTQESVLPATPAAFGAFHPVILCTSSRLVPGGEVSEGGYVQGAGDDSEGWARGLTSQLFWKNKERLMGAAEEDLPDLIQELLEASNLNATGDKPILVKPTAVVYLGNATAVATEGKEFDAVVSCGEAEDDSLRELLKSNYIHLRCTAGKLGSRNLREELRKLSNLLVSKPPTGRMLICCPTGKDLSVGVTLAILCLYFDEHGNPKPQSPTGSITKTLIRQRLSWIMTSHPSANPSRATLQSVNAFLMQRPSFPITSPKVQPTVDGHSPANGSSGLVDLPYAPEPPKDPSDTQKVQPSSTSAIFNALSGSWNINRTLTSHHPALPSGIFTGNATFTARTPTSRIKNVDAEYLYSETGIFKTNTGLEMRAGRKYVYRLKTATEEISVWFVGDDGESAAGLGWRLGSDQPDDQRKIVMKGGHLCGEDQYDARYEFQVKSGQRESMVDRFRLMYEVKGPRKDYVSETWFIR